MPKASGHLPQGFSTLSIHLTVNGATKYIEFLKQAFDAVELSRSASPDGRLLNASVRIGDSVMMLNDVFPEFGGKPIAPDEWPMRLRNRKILPKAQRLDTAARQHSPIVGAITTSESFIM